MSDEDGPIVLSEGLPDGYMQTLVDKFFPFIHPADPNPGEKISYTAKKGRYVIGSVSIKKTADGRNDIGVTVVPSRQHKGTGEAIVKLLMGKHPEEIYDWKCHKDNLPSLKLLRLLGGGLFPDYYQGTGTMVKGMIRKDGFTTDSMKEALDKIIEESEPKFKQWSIVFKGRKAKK